MTTRTRRFWWFAVASVVLAEIALMLYFWLGFFYYASKIGGA